MKHHMGFWNRLFIGSLAVPFLTCAASVPANRQEALAQRWTRADLEETMAESREWMNNDIGKDRRYAPPPWTAMQVNGQDVECWGRVYRYKDSILPVQIISQGKELFSDSPRFVLMDGSTRYEFRDADVAVEKEHDGLVRVQTVSRSGPYTLTLHVGYEFDGMGKIEVSLEGEPGATANQLHLEIPLRAERSPVYHLSAARGFGVAFGESGGFPDRPSGTTAGLLTSRGEAWDQLWHIVWIGDEHAGLAWFTESLQGWNIRDTSAIQAVSPEQDGTRTFRVKLADRRFSLDTPMELVFGIQATPMRPRPADFRSLCKWGERWEDERTIPWKWHWLEGQYYMQQSNHAEAARESVEAYRERGMEVMPISSQTYMGMHRYHSNDFGVMENPGMKHREGLLWGLHWGDYCVWCMRRTHSDKFKRYDWTPEEAQRLKETALRNRAAGKIGGNIEEALEKEHVFTHAEWFGRKHHPRGQWFYRFCPASSYQDYYLWRLKQLIQDTGIRAIYFDQGLRACLDAEHGCGHVDHKGEWANDAIIFESREMMKRLYFLFYEMNGVPPLVKWHQSSGLAIPPMSFVDIHYVGEAYRGSQQEITMYGQHFYSNFLWAELLQVAHTGKPFGFLSVFLPQIRHDRAVTPRTPATERDMLGLMMIHDSHIEGMEPHWQMNYPGLVHHVQRKRLSYPLDRMLPVYYWEADSGIAVTPERVKPILHYDRDHALLIVFNWSDEIAEAEVAFDPGRLGVRTNDIVVTDVFSEVEISRGSEAFHVDLLPRDFRMLEVRW